MRTSNRSILPKSLIKETIRFLKTQFSKDVFNLTEIRFLNNIDDEENQSHMSGMACEKDFTPKLKHIYLIEIYVGKKIKYPSSWYYRKSVPPPIVKNELENLIFTLAHELEHIEQFILKDKAPYFFEVAARKKS